MGSISPSAGEKQFTTPWVETPLVESAALSRAAGCRIFLKLENVQPSGSFKSRAMGSQIISHLKNPENANRPVHFFASSGGNAGLAAVCAAKSLGYPCTVVVPMSTKPLMVGKLLTAGATDVIQHGDSIAAAGEYMREVVMKTLKEGEPEDIAKIALHPFDNLPIWEGNSTIVDELAAQLPAASPEEKHLYEDKPIPVDGVICSVGGGGLLNGLIMGLERHKQFNPKLRQQTNNTHLQSSSNPIHFLAVETAGTDSLAQALEKKSLISLPKITSQAFSLGCIRVSEKTFGYASSPPPGMEIHSAVFSDADAARGVLRLADDERLLVELACGVCVEAAVGDAATAKKQGTKRRRLDRDEGYSGGRSSADETDVEDSAMPGTAELGSKLKQLVPGLNAQSRVVIVVCGGSGITIDLAAEYRAQLKDGWV